MLDDYNAQWTMATTSSALTICFVVEVFMKMIAFTPYGISMSHYYEIITKAVSITFLFSCSYKYNSYFVLLHYCRLLAIKKKSWRSICNYSWSCLDHSKLHIQQSIYAYFWICCNHITLLYHNRCIHILYILWQLM